MKQRQLEAIGGMLCSISGRLMNPSAFRIYTCQEAKKKTKPTTYFTSLVKKNSQELRWVLLQTEAFHLLLDSVLAPLEVPLLSALSLSLWWLLFRPQTFSIPSSPPPPFSIAIFPLPLNRKLSIFAGRNR